MAITPDGILQKLNSRVCHYVNHTLCETAKKEIIHYCDNVAPLDSNFLSRYINTLLYKPGCLGKYSNWMPAIYKICEKTDIDKKSIMNILKSTDITTNLQFLKFLSENKFEVINTELLEAVIKEGLFESVDYLVNLVVSTPACIEAIVSIMKNYPHYNNNRWYGLIVDLLKNGIKPSEAALTAAINCKSYRLVDLFIKHGALKVSGYSRVFTDVCKSRDINMISRLVMCKVPIDKNSFKSIFFNVSKSIGSYMYDNIFTTLYIDAVNIADIIELLLRGGYSLDYDDIVYAAEHRCYVNDISRFKHIKLDSNFLEVCTEASFYPYDCKKLKPTIKCLAIECRKGNYGRVTDIINDGIKPDISCLKACFSSNINSNVSTTIIELLINRYNVIPDAECIILYSNIILRNNTMTTLVNGFVKNNVITPIKIFDNIKADNIKEDNIRDNNKDIKDNKEQIILDKDDYEEDEENKEYENKDKIKKKLVTNKLDLILLDENKIKIPNDKKTKMVINPDVLTFLRIKKNTKMSFLDVRKQILEYIIDCDIYDKNMIILDKDLCKAFSLKKGMIEFDSLDKLVGLSF